MPIAESLAQNHKAINNNNATGFIEENRSPCTFESFLPLLQYTALVETYKVDILKFSKLSLQTRKSLDHIFPANNGN